MGLRRWLREPELIGAPDCPIIRRWTLFDIGRTVPDPSQHNDDEVGPGFRSSVAHEDTRYVKSGFKFMVHHFPAAVDERDPHDHPRPFLTFVVKGGYDDISTVDGAAETVERMKAGKLRYRPARHSHKTRAHAGGCWTLVVMGPLQRGWGFWRDGKWWPHRKYGAAFGYGMACEDDTPKTSQ